MALLLPVRGVDEPEVVRGLDIGEGDILSLKCCGDLECKRGLPMGDTGHDMFLGIGISLEVRTTKSEKMRIAIGLLVVIATIITIAFSVFLCVRADAHERERERESD